MPRFYVNTSAQSNGDHEVHEENKCQYPPNIINRRDLGHHSTCESAVKEAKNLYNQVNGCYHCCYNCHTT